MSPAEKGGHCAAPPGASCQGYGTGTRCSGPRATALARGALAWQGSRGRAQASPRRAASSRLVPADGATLLSPPASPPCVPTTLDSSPSTAAQADPGAQGTARGSSLPGSGAQHSASPPHCPHAGSAPERHHVTRSGSAPSRQRLGPRSSLQARAAQEASIPPRRLDLLAVGWSVTEKRRPCRGDRGRGRHGRTQPPAEPAQRRGGRRAADTVWTQGQQRRFRPCVWGDRAPTPTSHPPAFPEVTS